jgi:fatty-acyl-CoA synthase
MLPAQERGMNGSMMGFQLTLPAVMRRAESLFGQKEIVTSLHDKSRHRYTYQDMIRRAKQLALALRRLGIRHGDRVATFSWNHYQHLEAYFGIPACGGVLHTLNLRLHPDDLTYIANHAEDQVLLVDQGLWPLVEKFIDRVNFRHVVIIPETSEDLPEGTLSYEALLAAEDPEAFEYPDLDENQAVAMCYTSGTTGMPKGVLYSHRAIVLHTIANAMTDTLGLSESDVVVPVVPMFHANAWGLPFTALMVGAKQVFPGPHLEPENLLQLLAEERVTLTAGVPTIWLGILRILDREPKRFDLSSLHTMVVGGSAAPRALIDGFLTRHRLRVLHAWGMTELSPMGTVARVRSHVAAQGPDAESQYRARQGTPVAMVEIRARNEEGPVAWDGQAMGELEVRGPWVAASYYNSPEGSQSFTEDGWFRTGDIVSIFPDGSMQLQDRAKDVIKSGGEWISSVALENALMGHPAVAEAAVIPVAHPRWAERPLAAVVRKSDAQVSGEELLEYLRPHFAKWWLPDAIEFVDEIPKTSAGKFKKSELRQQFHDYYEKVSDDA